VGEAEKKKILRAGGDSLIQCMERERRNQLVVVSEKKEKGYRWEGADREEKGIKKGENIKSRERNP